MLRTTDADLPLVGGIQSRLAANSRRVFTDCPEPVTSIEAVMIQRLTILDFGYFPKKI